MGRAKALVEVDGVPMARRVVDVLVGAGCRPVELIGGDAGVLSVLGLPIVPDEHPGAGPLAGVITALRSTPGDVVVAACDLPYLTVEVVHGLIAAAADHPAADVIVARTDLVEPACALWRSSALPAAEGALASGEWAVHRLLARLRTVEVAVPHEELRNINAPDDLTP